MPVWPLTPPGAPRGGVARHRVGPAAAALAVALVVAALPACVTSGGGSGGSASGPITRAEIEASPSRNGYDLVQNLRPSWLRTRGSTSLRRTEAPRPVVYIDRIREESVESLRRIDSDMIFQVEFLSASDATTRFGTGHTGGAIVVTLRR
jgi:hypothetical protein